MRNIFKQSVLFTALLSAGMLCSCDDDTLGQADRLFRPVIGEETIGGTWIKLKWDRYEGANEFELELSTDSFANILQTHVTTLNTFTFEELEYDTKYNIRIKSLGNNIASEYYVHKDLTTNDFPTQLTTLTSSDVVDVAVRVQWNVTDNPYTSLSVFKKDTLIKSVDVTAAEYAAGEKIISGLEPVTSYFVKAYTGEDYKGKKSFKTASAQVFEGTVVDLRSFSDEEAYKMITQSFVDSIESGSTVVMNGGTTYLMPTLILSKDVTFVTGMSLNGKAIFAVDGNFDLAGGSEPISIILKDLSFTDCENKPKTSSNYGGTYLFNLGQANGSAELIRISGCDIKYKRGMMRVKSPNKLGTLEIDDVICDSIGGYGILNMDHAEAEITEVSIKNSTFSHTDVFIANSKGVTFDKLTVENITTFCTPASGKYFFDLNGKTIPGGLFINNNVYGQTKAPVKGLRSKATLVEQNNNYCTNDLAWVINETTLMPTDPLEVTLFNKSSYELFVNPDNLNLGIQIADFPGMGDPRWKN